ncbi:peptide/nickel transport system substrate-binding protein [Desulfofundulus luciae]|uniref:Peptide/nickel transport system substrate-binding protein n=1 Tax=Desulfofundulus luciae TaxID=74702 RepID=A0ABU0B187_9FIRM|nr:ABC transporter substrate-binding protein [Desulfofundulus luciae]MDQ0286496.1 peptide/nickel transport system substrate-binding protein [Desulfofundulus luciae]
MKNWARLRKKLVIPGILVLLVAMLLAGCGGGKTGSQKGAPDSQQSAREKIIRISEANVPNIDPGVGSDYASSIALANLYDTLVFPSHDGTLKPWLATDWKTSSDGLTWTFNLRHGVKFHNGDELTAEDVVFSMQRMLTLGEGYGYLFTDVVKEVKALDNYTVQFTLKKTFGPFLSTLVRLYILNKDQVMANIKPGPYGKMGDYGKDWLITNDAGSGPYMVKELKKQEHLYAVKFDHYWGGWDQDAPDSFKIIGTTSPSTIRTLMTRRELEITDQWQTKEALEALDRIPGVGVNAAFTGTILNIMFNTKKAPTDDVHFRKALAYAFDYDTVVDKLFPGSRKAKGPVSSVLPGFNPNLTPYERNLEKARAELAKSKYASRLDEYPVELAWVAEVPDEEKIALLLQSNAAELGIKVNVVKVPWLSFVDQVAKPENTPNASTVFVSPHYSEAGSILESRYHSKSTGTWEQCEWLKNAEIDAAIEDAISTLDTNKRFEKYRAIQEKIVDLAPTIWAFDQAEKRAYQEEYVVWPAADLIKQGKPVTSVMGYMFYFREFKVYPNKVPK